MENFNELQSQYNKILKVIEDKKQELNKLEIDKNYWKNKLWESRCKKETLSNEDIDEIFKKYTDMVFSDPYYNECKNGNACIRVSIGFTYRYFNLDENNKITSTYNADDELSQSLIGKYIDLNSYEGYEIKGNKKYVVGIIKQGKFEII